jgi:hypothetical protein
MILVVVMRRTKSPLKPIKPSKKIILRTKSPRILTTLRSINSSTRAKTIKMGNMIMTRRKKDLKDTLKKENIETKEEVELVGGVEEGEDKTGDKTEPNMMVEPDKIREEVEEAVVKAGHSTIDKMTLTNSIEAVGNS